VASVTSSPTFADNEPAGGGTVDWTNTSNILSDDHNYAVADMVASDQTNYLEARAFGFEIPDGSMIRGVEIAWTRRKNTEAGEVKDQGVFLTIGPGVSVAGSIGADPAIWTTTQTTYVYGNSSDLWSEPSIDVDVVNSDDFGSLLLVLENSGTDPVEAWVDFCEITVYYSGPVEDGCETVIFSQSSVRSANDFAKTQTFVGVVQRDTSRISAQIAEGRYGR